MPAYRIVLFRLKQDTEKEQVQSFIATAKKLGGEVPGVISLEVGPPVDMHRTKGYDMGIVLQVEKLEHLESFAASAGHLRLHELREALSEDSLAFNLVF